MSLKKNDEILREAKSFYQKLYTSTVAPKNDLYVDLFFPEGNTLRLNELEQQECGGRLTETMLEINPVGVFPCLPLINMCKGRVNDVTHCFILEKKVPSSILIKCLVTALLHINLSA